MMAEDRKIEDAKSAEDIEPRVLAEPGAREGGGGVATGWEVEQTPGTPWIRGLWMAVLAILFGVAQSILLIAAVLQFLWLLFGKEKNPHVAGFGKELADWLARVALFLTGATEAKPFPFARWGGVD